jgi:fructose/tagatose bisphosphate aldolase
MQRGDVFMSKNNIEALIKDAVFSPDASKKSENYRLIRETVEKAGIFPASIQALYEAAGKGDFKGVTVPAINLRMLTYDAAQAVFRAALKQRAGAFTFEIARSEIGYTKQSPIEYASCILAAAFSVGYQGPVFIQGDHYQVRRAMYRENPEGEINDIKKLIKDSIEAGFYNIDIDASTMVDISREDLAEQQANNSRITAELTKYIRGIEPKGITVSVGGEIGEIGKGNSTVDDLRAFMIGYLKLLPKGMKGISKMSVQTGTTHGGVAMPDGTIAKVNLDFDVLKDISKAAQEEYGMAGAVQHGASTLPDDAFDMFPKMNTIEVHLATGFQNMVYDSAAFPKDLLAQMYQYLDTSAAGERKAGETDEQFHYNTRKKAFGEFKKELWNLPERNLHTIMQELEDRFSLIFRKFNAPGTNRLVRGYFKSGTVTNLK